MRTLDYITGVLFLFILLYFIIKYRKNKDYRDFTTSNQSIGLWIIFASLSATFIGPGFSLGLVNEGHNTGLFLLVIAGTYGLAKIVEGALLGTKIRTKFSDAQSIGDIIAGPKSHDNKYLHALVGLISFCLLIGFSAVISKAGGELLNYFFGLPKFLGICILTIFVALYSSFGGIKASIYTDVIQFIVFVILIPLVLFFAISQSNFDVAEFNLNLKSLTSSAFENNSIIVIFGMVCTWFFGEMLIPPTINRILSTKNSQTSKKGLIMSGLFMIVWLAIMLCLGIVAKTNGLEGSDQTLLILGKNYLSFGLYGLFVVAMLSVVMSSLDSLINSASIVFTQDILSPATNFDDRIKLKIAKGATIIVAIFAILLTTYFSSILHGLLLVYSIWAPAILTVLFASIFLKKQYWQSGIFSIIFGIGGSLFCSLVDQEQIVPPILFGIFMSIISYALVHNFFKYHDKQKANRI